MNLFPRSKARSFSYAILLGSLLCATGSYLQGRPMPPKSEWLVEAGWLNEHLKDRVIVADTRTEQEYMQGHIPGAVWLDISGIGGRTSESALPLLHQGLAASEDLGVRALGRQRGGVVYVRGTVVVECMHGVFLRPLSSVAGRAIRSAAWPASGCPSRPARR